MNIIPEDNPTQNGTNIFKLKIIFEIIVMLPIEEIIVLYVPIVMRRAVLLIPGTTVPIASIIPDRKKINISIMLPFRTYSDFRLMIGIIKNISSDIMVK